MFTIREIFVLFKKKVIFGSKTRVNVPAKSCKLAMILYYCQNITGFCLTEPKIRQIMHYFTVKQPRLQGQHMQKFTLLRFKYIQIYIVKYIHIRSVDLSTCV